jgi:sulfonate transport system permease protein
MEHVSLDRATSGDVQPPARNKSAPVQESPHPGADSPNTPASRAAGSATGANGSGWALRWLAGAALPVVFLALWEIAARNEWIATRYFPPPSDVAHTIWALGQSGDLWLHVWATSYRVLLGFLFGVATGTALGSLTGYSTWARRLLDPSIQALRAIPSLAWVPLFILWLGIFETSKVTLIAVGVFFPVYLNLAEAIRNVDRKLVEVGRMYRFTGLQLVRYVLLPAALPSYVIGLRNGLGLGWMFVVAAELMGASEGLGYLLVDGQMTSRPATIMAAIVLFAIAGKITDSLLGMWSRHLLRWQDSFKTDV